MPPGSSRHAVKRPECGHAGPERTPSVNLVHDLMTCGIGGGGSRIKAEQPVDEARLGSAADLHQLTWPFLTIRSPLSP